MSQLSNEKFNLYMQMGDSVSAFAEIQSLCDEYPADLYHRVNMGSYYLQLGNFEKALEMNVSKPTEINLRGQSYIYGIITDSRIK